MILKKTFKTGETFGIKSGSHILCVGGYNRALKAFKVRMIHRMNAGLGGQFPVKFDSEKHTEEVLDAYQMLNKYQFLDIIRSRGTTEMMAIPVYYEELGTNTKDWAWVNAQKLETIASSTQDIFSSDYPDGPGGTNDLSTIDDLDEDISWRKYL